MKTIKHRFLDHKINPNTEILILGTFNPDTEKNGAEFFYGRSHNYLWRLLPIAFKKDDLKKEPLSKKLKFIKEIKIDFIDLIEEIKVDEGQETNYADAFIDSRVVKWRNVINEIKKLKKLRKVVLTRKSFNDIPKMKEQIKALKDYCSKNEINFEVLPTPARFYNEKKQNEWTNILVND